MSLPATPKPKHWSGIPAYRNLTCLHARKSFKMGFQRAEYQAPQNIYLPESDSYSPIEVENIFWAGFYFGLAYFKENK